MQELTGESASAGRRLPMPKLMEAYDKEGRGRWYTGETPDGGKDLPVLVFVPGLGESANCFYGKSELYGNNQMYERALADGFRTAFVSFMADGEKPYDMWRNGKMLAWQLQRICRYYQVPGVVVVAHSKGGVDAQAAAVFYGAQPMIRKLITLSTPHWGSQLADLAYSSLAWPLAEYLGQHSEGCFCMQTGYMRAFRKAVEASPSNVVSVETLAGNGGTPPLSNIWAGSQFLSRYGENDGVVTVKSAHNPRGRHLATLPLNHIEMMLGQTVWEYLGPAILGSQMPAIEITVKKEQPFGLIYRGGRLEKGMDETFPVDSTVKSLELIVFLKGGDGCEATEPDGTPHRDFTSSEFGGIRLFRLNIGEPKPGRWRVKSAPGQGAYFAVARLEGTFAVFPEETERKAGKMDTFLRVLRTFADRAEVAIEQKAQAAGYQSPIRLSDGVYTLETSVVGVLPDGSEFERSMVRPVMMGNLEDGFGTNIRSV